jgi:predicted phage tail protein
MIFWAGGMVNIMQDSPSSPVMQFSAANIIGKVSYKGSSRKDRATVALITYNDKKMTCTSRTLSTLKMKRVLSVLVYVKLNQ